MGYLRLWVSYAILFAVLATAEEKSGKVKPYEFGYVIEGQQHRYEKRDENGVITGDFGFVTGDGVYHATQFAADETGKFRITATRTVKIGLPGQPGSIPIPRDLFLRSDYFKLRDIKMSDTSTCSNCLVPKKPKPSVAEPKPLVQMTVKQKSDTVERTMTLEVVKLPSPKRVDPSPADVKRKEFAPVVHPPDAINPVNLFKPFVRKTETDSKSPTRSPEAKPKSFIPTSDNGGNIVEPPKSVDIPDSKILKLTIDTKTQPQPFTLTNSSREGKSFKNKPPSETVPVTESPILFIQPISKPKSSITQISGKAQTAVKAQTQGTLGQNDLPHLKPVTKFIPEAIPVIKGSAEKVPVLEKGIVPTPFDPVHTHSAQFKVDHGNAQTSSEGKNSVVLEDIPSLVSDSPVNTKVHQTKPSKVDSELVNLVEPESRKSLEQVPHLPLKPVVVELHKESLKPSLESPTSSSESSNPTELPTLSISSSPRDSGEFEERLHDGDFHDIVPPSVSQYETSRQRPLTPSRKEVLSTNLPAMPSTSLGGLINPRKKEDYDDDSFVHQTSEDGETGVNNAPDSKEPISPPRPGTEVQEDTPHKGTQVLPEKDNMKVTEKSSSKSETTKPEAPPFKKPLVRGKLDTSKQPELLRRKPQVFEDQGGSQLFDSVKPKSSPKSDITTQQIPSFKKPAGLQEEDIIIVHVPDEPKPPANSRNKPEVPSFKKPLVRGKHVDGRGPIDEEPKSSPESENTRPESPLFKPLVIGQLDSSDANEDSKLSDSEETKSSPKPEKAKQEVPQFKKPLAHGEQELKPSPKSRIPEPEVHAFKKPLEATKEYYRKSVETSSSKSGGVNLELLEEDDSTGHVLKKPKLSSESGITRAEVPSFKKPLVPRVQDSGKEHEKSSSKSGITRPDAPSFKTPHVLPEDELSPESGITRPEVPSFKKPLVPRVQDSGKEHEKSSSKSGITKPDAPSFKTPQLLPEDEDSKGHVIKEPKLSPELGITRPEVPSFKKPLVPRVQDSGKVYENSASKSRVTKPDVPSSKTPHVLPEDEDSKGQVLKEPKLSPEAGITRPEVPSFKKPLVPQRKVTTKTHEISPPESVITKPETFPTEGIASDEQTNSEGPYSEEPQTPKSGITQSTSKPEITRTEVPSFKKPLKPRVQDSGKEHEKSSSKSGITKPDAPSFKPPHVLPKEEDSKGHILKEPKLSPESGITRPVVPSFKKPLVPQRKVTTKTHEISPPESVITKPETFPTEGIASDEQTNSEGPYSEEPQTPELGITQSTSKPEITRPEVPSFKKPLKPRVHDSGNEHEKSSSKSGTTKPNAPSFKTPHVLPEDEDSKGHVLKEPKLSPELGVTRPEVPSFKKPLKPIVQDSGKEHEKSSSKSGITKPDAPSFKPPHVLPEEEDSKGHILKEPKLSAESGITRPVVPSFKKPLVPQRKVTTKTHEISPPESVITKPETFPTEGIASDEQTNSEGPYSEEPQTPELGITQSTSKPEITRPEVPSFKKPLKPRVHDSGNEHEKSSSKSGTTKPNAPSFKTPHVLPEDEDSKGHVLKEPKLSPELGVTRPEVPSFKKPLKPIVQDSGKEHEKSSSKSGITKPDAPSFKPPHVLPEEEDSKGHILKEPKLSPESGITRPVVPSFKKPLKPRVQDSGKEHEKSSSKSGITKPDAPSFKTTHVLPEDEDSKGHVIKEPKLSPELVITRPEVPSFKKPLVPRVQDSGKEHEKSSSKSEITSSDTQSFKTPRVLPDEDEKEDHGKSPPVAPVFKKPPSFKTPLAPRDDYNSKVPVSQEPKSSSEPRLTKPIPSFKKPLLPQRDNNRKTLEEISSTSGIKELEVEDDGQVRISEKPAPPSKLASTKPDIPSFRKPLIPRKGAAVPVTPLDGGVLDLSTAGVSKLSGSVPRRKGMRRKIIKRPGSSRQTGENGVSPPREDVLTDTVTPKPIASTADNVPTARLNTDTNEDNRRRTGEGPDKETSKKRTKTPSASPQIIDKIIVNKPTVTETYNTPATTARIGTGHDRDKPVISIPSTSQIQDSTPVVDDDLTTSPTPKSIPTDKHISKEFKAPGSSRTQGGRFRPSKPEIKDVLTTRVVQKPTVTEVSQTPSTETNLEADDLTQDVVELEVPSPVHDAHSAPSKKPKDKVSELGVSLSPEKDDQRKVVKVPPLVLKDILTTVVEPSPTIPEVSQPHTEKPQTEELEVQIPKSSSKRKPGNIGQTRKTRVKGKPSPTSYSNKGRATVPPLKRVRVSPKDKTTEGLKTLKIEMDSLTPRDRIVAYVTDVPVQVDMTVRGPRKEIDNFVTLSAPKHVPETATEPSRIHISGNSGETELPSIVPIVPVTPSSFPIPIRPLKHNHDYRDPSTIVSSHREGQELTIDKSPFVDGTLQDSKTRVTGHPTQVPRPQVPQKVTGTLESGVKVPSIPKSDSTKSPLTFDKIDITKPQPTPSIVTSSFPIKSSPTPSQNKPINQARDRDQATSAPVVQAPTLKPLAVEQSSALPPSRDPLLPTAPRDTEEAPYVPTPAPKQGTTSSERDSRKLFQVPSGDLQKLSLEDQTVLAGVDVRPSFGETDTQQPTRGPQRPQFGVLKTEENYATKPIKFDPTPKSPKIAPVLVQKVPDTFSQPKTLKIEVTTLPPPVVPVEQPNLSPRDPEPARLPQPASPTRSPSLSSRITPTKDEKFVPKSQVLKPKSSIKSTPQQFEPIVVPITQTQTHSTEGHTKYETDILQAQGLPGRSQLTRPSARLPPVKPAKEEKFVPKSQVTTTLTGKTPSAPKPAVQSTTGEFEPPQVPVTQAPEGYTTQKTDTQQTEGVTGTGRLSAHLPSVKQTKDEKFVPKPQVSTTIPVQLTQPEFEQVTVTQTPQEYRTDKTATPQTQGLSGTGPSVKSTQSHVSKPKPSSQSTPRQFEPVTLTHPSEGHPAHKTDTPQAQSLPGTTQPTRPAALLPAPKPAPAPKLVSVTPHTAPPPALDARGPVHGTHPTQTLTEAPTRLPSTGFKSDLKNVEIKSVSGGLVTSKPASGTRSPSSKVLPNASLGFTPSPGGKPAEAQKPPGKPELLDGSFQTSRGSPTTPKAPLQPKTVPQAGGTLVGSTGRRPAQQTKTQSDRQPVSKPGSEGAPRVNKPKITDSPQTSGLDTRFNLEDDSGKRQQRPKPVSITPLATGDRQGRKGFGDEKPSTLSGRVSEGASRGSVKHRTSSLGGILYRFNYTVGYHGHHEQGDTIGNKDGGYEFVGRDGVLRRVEYVANEFGYQPHVSQHTVGAERTPKEETEKEAGLKGYEFKWFNPK